mmetsp:Transcript_2813/g.3887  ORF Transcript_2813/g.3887 Transcript_2813/m.3887 type:complete len:529 (+) Transcript_2813:69-1655(+)
MSTAVSPSADGSVEVSVGERREIRVTNQTSSPSQALNSRTAHEDAGQRTRRRKGRQPSPNSITTPPLGSLISFHNAGDPKDWESSISAMEKAQASGSWNDNLCSFLRVPFGPLLHILSFVNGIELARLETACPPLARTRMCETASKAMVMASLDRSTTRRRSSSLKTSHNDNNQKVLPRNFGITQSWKRLTGWIGSPPAWCVLNDLYEATDGDNAWEWADGWRAGGRDIDVSRWFGVTAKSGRVIGLALFSNSLRGELPPAIGSLANLRELLLHHNQLVGTIPASLGRLTRLETLDLSANKLAGPLPSDLFPQSSRLAYLNLASNRLSGEIPPHIGNLAKLEALHLDHNSFTGVIPNRIGDLARLEVLNISNCWLTHQLPIGLGRLSSLRVLYLGHNRLTGNLDVLAPLCSSAEHSDYVGGQLREVYANDNSFDVSAIHPALCHLSVLFVDRNKTEISSASITPLGSPRRDPLVSPALPSPPPLSDDLQREMERITQAMLVSVSLEDDQGQPSSFDNDEKESHHYQFS